jgi:hypothetical protein
LKSVAAARSGLPLIYRRMSEMGQKRRFGDVRVTSASPPKADIHREVRHVRLVPKIGIGGALQLRPSHTTVRTGPYTAV